MKDRMLKKDMIHGLNAIAQDDFDRAKAMLDGINMVLGTKYGWFNKRVSFFDDPDGGVAAKYAHIHDAWANADD